MTINGRYEFLGFNKAELIDQLYLIKENSLKDLYVAGGKIYKISGFFDRFFHRSYNEENRIALQIIKIRAYANDEGWNMELNKSFLGAINKYKHIVEIEFKEKKLPCSIGTIYLLELEHKIKNLNKLNKLKNGLNDTIDHLNVLRTDIKKEEDKQKTMLEQAIRIVSNHSHASWFTSFFKQFLNKNNQYYSLSMELNQLLRMEDNQKEKSKKIKNLQEFLNKTKNCSFANSAREIAFIELLCCDDLKNVLDLEYKVDLLNILDRFSLPSNKNKNDTLLKIHSYLKEKIESGDLTLIENKILIKVYNKIKIENKQEINFNKMSFDKILHFLQIIDRSNNQELYSELVRSALRKIVCLKLKACSEFEKGNSMKPSDNLKNEFEKLGDVGNLGELKITSAFKELIFCIEPSDFNQDETLKKHFLKEEQESLSNKTWNQQWVEGLPKQHHNLAKLLIETFPTLETLENKNENNPPSVSAKPVRQGILGLNEMYQVAVYVGSGLLKWTPCFQRKRSERLYALPLS